MNQLLAFLVVFVFLHGQAFALSGGPVFPGASQVDVEGTYSGVLIEGGSTEVDNDGLPANTEFALLGGSVGIFSLQVDNAGNATGAVAIFDGGRVYTGNATGFADSGLARLFALLDAQFNFNIQRTQLNNMGNLVVVSVPITATVSGTLQAAITVLGSAFGGGFTRILGTAETEINFGQVDGVTFEPIVARSVMYAVIGTKTAASAQL